MDLGQPHTEVVRLVEVLLLEYSSASSSSRTSKTTAQADTHVCVCARNFTRVRQHIMVLLALLRADSILQPLSSAVCSSGRVVSNVRDGVEWGGDGVCGVENHIAGWGTIAGWWLPHSPSRFGVCGAITPCLLDCLPLVAEGRCAVDASYRWCRDSVAYANHGNDKMSR